MGGGVGGGFELHPSPTNSPPDRVHPERRPSGEAGEAPTRSFVLTAPTPAANEIQAPPPGVLPCPARPLPRPSPLMSPPVWCGCDCLTTERHSREGGLVSCRDVGPQRSPTVPPGWRASSPVATLPQALPLPHCHLLCLSSLGALSSWAWATGGHGWGRRGHICSMGYRAACRSCPGATRTLMDSSCPLGCLHQGALTCWLMPSLWLSLPWGHKARLLLPCPCPSQSPPSHQPGSLVVLVDPSPSPGSPGARIERHGLLSSPPRVVLLCSRCPGLSHLWAAQCSLLPGPLTHLLPGLLPTACNCSGRSEECTFDRELFRSTGHGGRCHHCRDHTAGPHCERCEENFYHWDQRKPCQPCDCHPAG